MKTVESIILERAGWLQWKAIAPLRARLAGLPEIADVAIDCGDTLKLESPSATPESSEKIRAAAWAMKPWRKGPFDLFGIRIESEWRSHMKFNLLAPHADLEGKAVADVGCNNGYYLFRMLPMRPASLLGIDPSPLFKTQFDLINRYLRSPIRYEMLGIEHMRLMEAQFDTIFCLGVLYHRSDPISALKSLKMALKKGGELFLDTFIIDGDDPVCLVPATHYSKIANVHFVPTVPALQNWCEKAGFSHFRVLATVTTDACEQRRTEWMAGESLEDFLDPGNPSLTVEGYPAPKRCYVHLRKV